MNKKSAHSTKWSRAAIIPLVAVLVSIAIAWGWAAVQGEQKERALENNGRQAIARSTAKNLKGFRSGNLATISIDYKDTHGVSHSTDIYVTHLFYDKVIVGQLLTIEYDPQDPKNARIADRTYRMPKVATEMSLMTLQVITIIGVVLLPFVVYGWYKWYQRKKMGRS